MEDRFYPDEMFDSAEREHNHLTLKHEEMLELAEKRERSNTVLARYNRFYNDEVSGLPHGMPISMEQLQFMIKTLINLRQRYKNYTRKQYHKYYYEYDFKPHFKWNLFDTNNDWVYDIEPWRKFIWGWQSVGYAWEAWTYWMRDMKYCYKLPYAFWAELNDGYMNMYVYSWTKK